MATHGSVSQVDGQSADEEGGERGRLVYRPLHVALLCIVVAAVGLLCQADVGRSTEDAVVLWGRELPSTCIHRSLTGRDCPGCGLTRSVVLALGGRLAEARAMHPSGLWVTVWLLAQVIWRLGTVISAGRVRIRWGTDVGISLAALWLAVYLPIVQDLFRA
jgi:hypothetical protein